MWFRIGVLLEPCIYLAPLRRYYAPNILGSRLWPFGVTWRHQSRDHRTRREHFPIGGQWWTCIYLAKIQRYGASKILGSRVWPFGATWRHRSRDHWNRHMWFPIGGPLWQCVYLAPLGRYKASNLHLPMLKAKSSLRMPVSRDLQAGGPKYPIFGIPKSILPIHYTTSMRLRWRLRTVYRWNFYTGTFLAENNLKSALGPIFDFGEIFQGLNINFEFRFPKRFDPSVRPRCSSHRAWKSAGRSDL